MPVVGVETRKDMVAALEAPSFLKPAAKGITPQEQMGKGMPKTVAFHTGEKPPPPKCRLMNLSPIKA